MVSFSLGQEDSKLLPDGFLLMYGWMAGTERLHLVREALVTPRMIEHPCPIYIRDTLPIGASSKLLASKEWEKSSTKAHSPGPEDPEPPPEAREKPGRPGRGKIQRAPGLTIDQIVVSGRIRAHTPDGVSLYARWPLLRVFEVGQSEGPEPVSHGSSDPMREAGAPSTEEVEWCFG
jgi:hypothetical protein